MLLCFATMQAFASISPTYPAPPMYHIKASSLYDAGLQQGKLASSRIQGWLSSPEMVSLLNYSATAGRDAFQAIKRDNTAAYPALVKELEGLSAGSGVPLDTIWVSTLILELESLRSYPPGGADHCSDLYAVPEAGVSQGFAHGHNEDWPGPIHDFWYWLSITRRIDGDGGGSGGGITRLASCAGLAYPGALIGWAPSWNDRGMYLTQNSLFPRNSKRGGLASSFVQREALCGAAGGDSLDAVVDALSPSRVGGWAQAASVNIVDLNQKRMANVEIYEGRHAVYEVTKAPGAASNYSHFNHFKELGGVEEDGKRKSSAHRQARLDELPPSRTVGDIARRLSDRADEAYPIFRNMTLTSILLNGDDGALHAWCCGHRPVDAPPAYRWNLLDFFRT
jgi:hypothetical protein